MTIATRKLDSYMYLKTEKFLKKVVEDVCPDNMFFYSIISPSDKDNEPTLDALLHLKDGKIIIKTIWVMEYNHQKEMSFARNIHGESGRYAKVLAEKYFNRFFNYLDTIDVDKATEKQFMINLV